MADDSKVPTVEDGLATGVQSVGGVPVLMKEQVPVQVETPGEDLDAAKEKERVLAAFHATAPETKTEKPSLNEEPSQTGKGVSLAAGVQSVSGIPVLQKEVAGIESNDETVDAAKEKERVLAAFHATAPETKTEKPSQTAAEVAGKSVSLAAGVRTVSGIPVLRKEVAGTERNEDTSDAAKEKERVLAAFHSDQSPAEPAAKSKEAAIDPAETSEPAAKSQEATINSADTPEPALKASKKGTMAVLKDRVASAFKTDAKPEKEGVQVAEGETTGKEEGKPGAPTLKSRVYQSVGSIGGRLKTQTSLLRTSWKSEGKVGNEKGEPKEGKDEKKEEKDGSAEVIAVEGEGSNVGAAEAKKVETARPPPDLASPGVEKQTVKDRMLQRVGSLSEKVKQQASSMKSVWKPEDKKGDLKDEGEGLKAGSVTEPTVETPPSYEYGEGRVTVFSISGCPHCKAAKALLKKKGVRFAEVNLDVFPERREEMQERTGKSSCPQIFFNDKLIGGNDALQALENEGKLDADLKVVHETPVPSTAPAPPGPTKSDALVADQAPDEHLETVKWLREKLAIKDRWFKLRKYERCFVGSEAVDLVVEEKKVSRQEATSLLQKLQTKHFFHHVLREHAFKDGPFFYRLLEHEPFVKSAANWGGATSDSEPPQAVELGSRMRKLILAVYDEFLSDDGRHVDYRGIGKSEIFRRYVRLTQQLQRVDVLALSREEKLAFFINIYNALVIHVTVVLGHGPTTLAVRRTFFTEHTYIIGGSSYSLTAIENGVLRGNKRPPFFFSKPFSEKDDRLPVALTTPEPLSHFALVCGAKSCPPVKTYEPKGVDEALKAAAQGFFEGGGAVVDVEAKTIHLSKILNWYKSDFGATDLEVLKFVARFLTLKERDKLEALISEGKYKIEYQPYDWSANSAE